MADKKISKLSAGAESGDPRAIAASSREAKRKNPQDVKLIKKLFDVDPLDWARYPDGTLVFILPNGSKSRYTQEELKALSSQSNPSSTTKPKNKPAAAATAGAPPASQEDGGAPPPEAADAAAPALSDVPGNVTV